MLTCRITGSRRGRATRPRVEGPHCGRGRGSCLAGGGGGPAGHEKERRLSGGRTAHGRQWLVARGADEPRNARAPGSTAISTRMMMRTTLTRTTKRQPRRKNRSPRNHVIVHDTKPGLGAAGGPGDMSPSGPPIAPPFPEVRSKKEPGPPSNGQTRLRKHTRRADRTTSRLSSLTACQTKA